MRLLIAIAACLAVTVAAQSPPAVILVTLDGARIEEVFGGLDVSIVQSQLKEGQRLEDQADLQALLGGDAGSEAREADAVLLGHADARARLDRRQSRRGSRVHLTNRHWFSYPGYSEILVGRAHDDVIKSNDPIRNPNRTVLEFLKTANGLSREQVAAFASWDVFSAIVESKAGELTVNAGYQAFDRRVAEVRRQSALQFETPTPWDSVRHDAYTFRSRWIISPVTSRACSISRSARRTTGRTTAVTIACSKHSRGPIST